MDNLSKILISEGDLNKIKSNEDFELILDRETNKIFQYKGIALSFHKEEKGYSVLGDITLYEKAIDAMKELVNYNKK
jgi:hypothetical protein